MVERLAIVGTGLIGASVGLAARAAGVQDIRGWDVDAEALAVAEDRGAVASADSLAAAVSGTDLVVVAAPVAALPAQVAAALDASDNGTTVTDVGSTKGAVTGTVVDGRFIGGHPVCGSEAHGPAHANGELFRGATWFLTPVAATDPERYRTLHGFVAALGAVPVAVDPNAHDRLVALTSHLPHALANVLLNQAGASRVDGHEALAAAGGSLRDMTRVAGANPRIWVDIFLDNAEALAAALAEHRRRIEQLERALADSDAGFLARWIAEASGNRRRMLAEAYEQPGRAAAPARPRARQAGRARRHHAGARRRADQHRRLRAAAHVARARRYAHAPRRRRAGRAARDCDPRSPGLPGRYVARPRRMRIEPAGALVGHIAVPGDKSISHRAVLIGALCEGDTHIHGFGRSADTESTVAAVRALGVDVDEPAEDELVVRGVGLRGLREAAVDCGNAGTLMRLLTGILAGQEGRFELTGDESLGKRPMDRIAEPLARMGASIKTKKGLPPIVVEGSGALRAIDYALPVASAQVKSAILLAALNAHGTTTVSEPVPTRDHTEAMLAAAGAKVRRRPHSVSIDPASRLELGEVPFRATSPPRHRSSSQRRSCPARS